MKKLRKTALVIVLGLVAAAATGSFASGSTNAIVNGNFETGSMSGWGHAPGHPLRTFSLHGFYAVHGTVAPVSGIPIPPPAGHTQAVVDEIGPGSAVLFQTFTVPKNGHLSLRLWYANYAGIFFTPRMLVPSDDFAPNQQLRIDITGPEAGLYSLRPQDVLANVFRTTRSSPVATLPHTVSANLSALAGKTVRLRIAEVDDLFFFNVGVDNVTVTGTGGAAAQKIALKSAQVKPTAGGKGSKLYKGKPKSAF
jgi:hypothetical protein